MTEDKYQFGYPLTCNDCKELNDKLNLTVEPFYKPGSKFKLMLIGQDPTIFNDPDRNRVKQVLMLDDEKGQLRRWILDIVGKNHFEEMEIYATNLVKCTFDAPPSTKGGKKYLELFFNNCKYHLMRELKSFRPNLVFTFGEPAHYYFLSIITKSLIKEKMNQAFTGEIYNVKYDDFTFCYSPCLHIKTFRVAETYGEKVSQFKNSVNSILGNQNDRA